MAGSAPFVNAREHGRAADGHHAIIKMFGERVAKILLDTGHFHRREKFSVGQLRQAFGLAANAGELFHVVVPGRDVRIADRPIDRDSVLQIRFKVEIAPAIALAPPSERFSAHLAAANPGKMLAGSGGVRIFKVIDEKFVGVFVASVINLTLNGLRPLAFRAIVPSAIFQVVHRNVLDVVLLRNDGAARFEDQRVQSFFGELFGRPAAGDSRADDYCVVSIGGHVSLPYAFFSAGKDTQP